jgi:hypothetical protein
MKVSRFTEGTDGTLFSDNKSKSTMFAHSGSCYWNIVFQLYDTRRDDFELWDFMYVGAPLMHMAIELMTKALVSINDVNYNAKLSGHKITVILSNYADRIGVFDIIIGDTEKRSLIETLEFGWEGLRYGECSLEYCEKDRTNFDEIMTILSEEFKRQSGLKIL